MVIGKGEGIRYRRLFWTDASKASEGIGSVGGGGGGGDGIPDHMGLNEIGYVYDLVNLRE